MANSDDKPLKDLADDIHKAKVDAGLAPDPKARESAGRGMQAGVGLVGSVLVCLAAGIGLDRWLGTAPLFMLALLILGFVAGIWQAYRSTQ